MPKIERMSQIFLLTSPFLNSYIGVCGNLILRNGVGGVGGVDGDVGDVGDGGGKAGNKDKRVS